MRNPGITRNVKSSHGSSFGRRDENETGCCRVPEAHANTMKYKKIVCRAFLFWSVDDNTLLVSLTLIARVGAYHSGGRRYAEC